MLRRRVALAFLGLIVASALLMRGVLWFGDEWVEDAALADLLEHEMALLLKPGSGSANGRPAALRHYRPSDPASAPLPEALRPLGPGLYEEVRIDGEPWRVLVREVAPGDRAYLMYLTTFIERRENILSGVAAAGIVLLLLGSWWLARAVASRALAPLDALVAQLRALDPDRRNQRLVASASGEDLAVITGAINRYLAQLDALVEREAAFAAGASHELRTPLALIQGSAEQIAAGQGDSRVIERLRRGVRGATEQVEALLALSRSREVEPSKTLRLDRWLQAAAEPLIADAGAAGRVRWTTQPVELDAPPGAVRIVFGNLLQNALRADPAGEVTVIVAPGSVAVEDRGPGIADEVLRHAFEPGFRGRSGGSGMGLYIARVLADRCGWSLSLQNRPGGGARVEWRFPQARPGPASTGLPSAR